MLIAHYPKRENSNSKLFLSEIVCLCYHTTTISPADHYHNLAVSDSMLKKKLL